VDAGGGDNTGDRLNFLPHMDAAQLVEGYRSVLKRIYSCEAYYERVKLYLSRTQPKPQKRRRRVEAAVADARQCARFRDFDCAPGSLWAAALELLEVSDGGGDTLSPLLWRGHDAGGDGVSLPGDDAEADAAVAPQLAHTAEADLAADDGQTR
jgi:hypothetical protein